MYRRLTLVVAALALLSALTMARPLAAQETNGPQQCHYCAILYHDGVPAAAFCYAGGSTFQSCWASGINCHGDSCGWASSTLVPMLERFAANPHSTASVDGFVRQYSKHLRWAADDRTIEVRDCAGKWTAQIVVHRPKNPGRVVRQAARVT